MLSQEKNERLTAVFRAGEDRNFLCWCPGCGLTCTVVLGARVVSHEPEH